MKICVTGNAGFLGSHLTERLQAMNHEVFGIDNMIGGNEDNINCYTYFEDTADYSVMNDILAKEKPDVVYHCAALAYEGLSVFSPSVITQNVFQNTVGMLSASIQNGVERFIYTSSMSRYGAQEPPFTEDMEPDPEDPYAVAKVAAEKIIQQMAETHGIEYVIAVPHNIIGPRQKYDDPFRNVASIFINRCLQGKPPIIYGDGEQTRSFSFVDDCLYSLVRMIDCPSGGVYNIGPGEEEKYTINELAREVLTQTVLEREPEYIDERPREVKHAYCSSEKIEKMFGYKTETSLKEGIGKMVEDIRRKGTKPFEYHLPVEIVTDKTPKTWTKEMM